MIVTVLDILTVIGQGVYIIHVYPTIILLAMLNLYTHTGEFGIVYKGLSLRRHATSEVIAVKSLKGVSVRLSKLKYTMQHQWVLAYL